tara:strand:+ start:181 stop:498 length:318 start_codon:yes stop_codon:yes gene_type:complete
MLVVSNFKKGDIVTVKLSTGEEIVARFESFNMDELKVVKPTVLTLNPQNGQAMLIAWLMSIDAHNSEPVSIKGNQIVATARTIKSLADSYTQSTTGIAPASALQL